MHEDDATGPGTGARPPPRWCGCRCAPGAECTACASTCVAYARCDWAEYLAARAEDQQEDNR
ncbi:hypothetical protein GCM10010303_79990 [Streptomyces purpurascens]|nr:hypothetical protein GCM10010303_79990 [Streptomyces purpurascens]